MSDLNGVPIPHPSDGQPPATSPMPPSGPNAYAAFTPPVHSPAAPASAQPAAPDPGRTLGIVGFILAFLVSPAGIVVSAIGLYKSRKAGRKNGLALAGLIVSIVFFIVTVLFIMGVAATVAYMLAQCADLGGGVQTINGTAVTCAPQ